MRTELLAQGTGVAAGGAATGGYAGNPELEVGSIEKLFEEMSIKFTTDSANNMYVGLESIARACGWTEKKNDVEYVMWRRVREYLADIGFGTCAERIESLEVGSFTELFDEMGIKFVIDQDNNMSIGLESIARACGWTQIAKSGNEVVRWERVKNYLSELGVPNIGDGMESMVIPERMAYVLIAKADIKKNPKALKFMMWVGEILESARKHGGWIERSILESDESTAKLLADLKAENAKKDALIAAKETALLDTKNKLDIAIKFNIEKKKEHEQEIKKKDEEITQKDGRIEHLEDGWESTNTYILELAGAAAMNVGKKLASDWKPVNTRKKNTVEEMLERDELTDEMDLVMAMCSYKFK